MLRRSRGLVAVILVVVCGVVLFVASRGWAKPEESKNVAALLPANTFLYIHWDGVDQHRAAWEKTAAHEAAVKSGLWSTIYKMAGSFFTGEAGAVFEDVTKSLGTVVERGASLSVALSDNMPFPYGVLVLHKSADLEPQLARLFKNVDGNNGKLEERTVSDRKIHVLSAPDASGVELGWWIEGEHLVLAVGIDAVQTALNIADGKAENITANSVWSSRRDKPADFEAISDAWLDFTALRNRFGPYPVPMSRDPQAEPVTVNRILEALGLDKLGTIAYRGGFKERAMWSELVVDAPAPRKGLLALADQRTLSLKDLPPLPANTPSFGLTSFDAGRGYDTFLRIVKEIASLENKQNIEDIDQAIARLNEMAQFDVKQDLIDALGDVACIYSDPGQGPMGFGFGVAVSVDDAARLRKAFDKLIGMVENVAGPKNLQVSRNKKDNREIITFGVGGGFVIPALCVDEKWLVIGLTPQSVNTFLLRLDKKLPQWTPSDEVQAALDTVPKEFVSLSVSDPRPSIQSMMTLATTMGPAMLAGARQQIERMQRESGNAPPEGAAPQGNPFAELPPAELVMAPLFPNVSVCVVNEAGILIRERTSLPASMGIGAMPVAAVGVALLLPAVQAAREAARRTQSMNNIKQQALALHNYHDVYRTFPQAAHPNDKLQKEKQLSWLVDILPFVEQSALYNTVDLKKAWDDDANKGALQTQVPVYLHPSVPPSDKNGYPVTNYVGFAGIGKDGPTLPVKDPKAGMWAYNRATKIQEVLDGTSNTMFVTETSKNLGPWAAATSSIRPLTGKPVINGPDGFGGISPGGANVGLVDGSVRFLSQNIDPKVFEALITPQGGEQLPNF